ncbi:peptidase S49 [Nitrincola sp. A-D6]|uniref:S49 family peptidase n=1 Tax=Nitrincola sp. A-D6 TaxID=1545442 RepID=UPI00051FD95E|nr:S49 family peptidase [Nitrincola sp. A-D6]KGK42274.1 peptidase S49 [Nitrincola sp. A-D6]
MSNNHWDDPDKKESPPELLSEEPKADAKVKQALDQASAQTEKSKEWRLIEKIVSSLNVEQRRSRRWGIFFKSLTFIYLFALLAFFLMGRDFSGAKEAVDRQPHVALIEVRGIIADGADASADNIITALRRAFSSNQSRAIILRINSPGGAPVQAGYINDEIVRLKGLHPDKKVYAVIADIGASGGYYIAVAADEIYADKASLVGSIGVTASGFGFVDLIDKMGIERRIMTSGENKAFLDPFSPQREDETEFWESVLETTHRQFINEVKQGRGERLSDEARLFTGLVWSGEQALELGLIDGLGSSSYVARELVKIDRLVDYTYQPSSFDRLVDRLGVSFAKHLSTQMVEYWSPRLQ